MQPRNRQESVIHTFRPVYDENSKVLMLGTMPSPKSREQGFYYGHPRNRFWPVLAEVLGEPLPETVEEKIDMALRHHIAVWDVLAGCDICGADDSTIRNPVPNDMNVILQRADIRAVFTTGQRRMNCIKSTVFRLQNSLPSGFHRPARLTAGRVFGN